MDLLRILTAGSVDDGKSTILGRLQIDADLVFEDHLESLRKASGKHNKDEILDFALLCDGLKAEREQGITIDVAYRFMNTSKRKFIIADCPGHVQYTKNMAVGASVSDMAILLIDAKNGILPQTKRHSLIITMMGIRHLLVIINKMDLVGYKQDVYDNIKKEYLEFIDKMEVSDLRFIPVSALKGDNVVKPSNKMPWYRGGCVLEYLENIHVSSDRNLIDLRVPIQYVIRTSDFRGYAGSIASGVIRVGDKVRVLGTNNQSTVSSLRSFDGSMREAFSPQAVTIELDDNIDISRGDILVRTDNVPPVDDHIESMVVWMDDQSLKVGNEYYIKHNTKFLSAKVEKIIYKLDLDTISRVKSDSLNINDIGRILWSTNTPTIREKYIDNKNIGKFIIIDKITNSTSGAAVIIDKKPTAPKKTKKRNKKRGFCLWLTGLSGSGKTTIAKNLINDFPNHIKVEYLDGDILRNTPFAADVGYDEKSRKLHISRVLYMAKLLVKNNINTVCTFISPHKSVRDMGRSIDNFIEIYVKCNIDECRNRDPKGLYKRVDKGEISNFTGIDSPYEEPENPNIIVETDKMTVDECVDKILRYLEDHKLI